jgi:ABC-type nitrate/sulfonate/bicarbonate transport system permease component
VTTLTTRRPPGVAQGAREGSRIPWAALGSITVVILGWQVLAQAVGKGGLLLPTPVQVVQALVEDARMILSAVGSTLITAGLGLFWGSLAAILLALPTVLLPGTRRFLVRQMTIFYCLPLVTIAPLLYLLASGRTPQVIMAALSVLFPVFIAVVQGLGAHHAGWADLVASLGGGRWLYFRRVQVPAATREFFTAARVAGPAAVLGATLAEYFGGTRGLGVVMINALAQLNAPRAYALGLVITLLSSGAFLLVGAINRRFFPWTEELGND